jgi:hypothetical protein
MTSKIKLSTNGRRATRAAEQEVEQEVEQVEQATGRPKINRLNPKQMVDVSDALKADLEVITRGKMNYAQLASYLEKKLGFYVTAKNVETMVEASGVTWPDMRWGMRRCKKTETTVRRFQDFEERIAALEGQVAVLTDLVETYARERDS